MSARYSIEKTMRIELGSGGVCTITETRDRRRLVLEILGTPVSGEDGEVAVILSHAEFQALGEAIYRLDVIEDPIEFVEIESATPSELESGGIPCR
jgi:hypothetical protein